jgi:Glycine zipper
MKRIGHCLVLLQTLWLAASVVAVAAQPIIYPARGQSPERQQTDTAECNEWAQQTTGVNPVTLAEQMSSSPPPPQQQGQMLRGAGGGALFGTLIGGAAGGHWGEGAAVGALVGTMGSGMRMRREQQQEASQQQGMQQQVSNQLSLYNRAVGACMTGRGYTVE